MNFDYSTKTLELQKRLRTFMDEFLYPNERAYHDEINAGNRRHLLKLKAKAK